MKEGVESAGLVGMRFNTIGVSDGISMGTDGMSYSLQSRDLIADSIETVMGAQWYDANISIPGCDKNMPGCLMAMGRLNRPSLMVYGGTIRAGHCRRREARHRLRVPELRRIPRRQDRPTSSASEIVRHACPGAGACGGMYTANTMASAIEALGMSLPYSSSMPAEDPRQARRMLRGGRGHPQLLELDLKPRDIMTREAFENAMVLIMALGGSTNAVLHLIAMARSVGRAADDRRFPARQRPRAAAGRLQAERHNTCMEDLHKVGGTPAVMKMLLEAGLLNGDCMTVTGKTLAENLSDLPGLTPGQPIVRPLSNPIKATGHIQILRGNLRPDGAVAKITGKEGLRFSGPAKVYDSEEDMLHALERKRNRKRATSSSSATKGPRADPACPRC